MVYRSPRPPSDLAADAAEFREPAFRDALVAGVAMVAHADGAPSPAERSRFLSLLEEDPALKPPSTARSRARRTLAAREADYRFDVEVGTLMARETLVRIAGRTRLCAALVQDLPRRDPGRWRDPPGRAPRAGGDPLRPRRHGAAGGVRRLRGLRPMSPRRAPRAAAE